MRLRRLSKKSHASPRSDQGKEIFLEDEDPCEVIEDAVDIDDEGMEVSLDVQQFVPLKDSGTLRRKNTEYSLDRMPNDVEPATHTVIQVFNGRGLVKRLPAAEHHSLHQLSELG